MATPSPSAQLMVLVQYIVRVYAPCWFDIREKQGVWHGASHLFNIIERMRWMDEVDAKVVESCINNNSYYLHQVGILSLRTFYIRPTLL